MRISDWSSDVCSSDLARVRDPRGDRGGAGHRGQEALPGAGRGDAGRDQPGRRQLPDVPALGSRGRRRGDGVARRSEEHTSELQSLMRNSYAVFRLKKKKNTTSKGSYYS